MKHVLVIGGTGMLTKVSLWLADQGYIVSVVGRDKQKLYKLTDLNKQQIIPISVDYYNLKDFEIAIHNSVVSKGPYELVVAQIHSNDIKIIDIISSENSKAAPNEWSLYHVLGSSENIQDILREITDVQNYNYYQVQLGFMMENNSTRWLTHNEISSGVIDCIRTKSKKYIVGTLTPWEKRP